MIIKKWEVIVISILSILFGITLIRNPEIFIQYKSYEVFRWWFNSWVAGSIFIGAGSFKLLTLCVRSRPLQVISVSILVGVWLFSGASFHMSSVSNTIYLLNYANAAIALGTLLREVLE